MDENDGPRASAFLCINNLHIIVDAHLNFIITDHESRCFTLPIHIYWEFMQHMEHINENLMNIVNNKEVFYKLHLGGNYFVHMQTPFWLVSFERLFTPDAQSVQLYDPLRLKIGEWVAFKMQFQNSIYQN